MFQSIAVARRRPAPLLYNLYRRQRVLRKIAIQIGRTTLKRRRNKQNLPPPNCRCTNPAGCNRRTIRTGIQFLSPHLRGDIHGIGEAGWRNGNRCGRFDRRSVRIDERVGSEADGAVFLLCEGEVRGREQSAWRPLPRCLRRSVRRCVRWRCKRQGRCVPAFAQSGRRQVELSPALQLLRKIRLPRRRRAGRQARPGCRRQFLRHDIQSRHGLRADAQRGPQQVERQDASPVLPESRLHRRSRARWRAHLSGR